MLFADKISYNPATGVFWNHERNRRAGTNTKIGNGCYRILKVDGKKYKEHHLAFLFMLGRLPEKMVDHVDGNGCNNKWHNLRECGRSENNRNRAIQKNSSTMLCGVHIDRKSGMWRAEITKDKVRFKLGFFDNLFDAACTRKSKEIEMGFHKNHGRVSVRLHSD